MRTLVYVDGFNLYYGAVRGTRHKWLDIHRLTEMHLAAHHRIVEIKYFTARLNPRPHNPDQPIRQALYLRALATIPNLQIIYGHFLTKVVRMQLANPLSGQNPTVQVLKTEEKGSDVNLGTNLVHDGHMNHFDCAVVISGDSDLLEPVRIIMSELKKPVGVLNPQRHPCAVLKRQATFYKHLRPNFLANSGFPATMVDAQGTFHKPVNW